MKKLLILALLLLTFQGADAQKMRTVFAEMPDSILTLMTRNNRLDCIDFIENDMQARVRNRLDGFSELKEMNDDYLQLQLTAATKVEMKLLPGKDTLSYIAVAKTYQGPAPSSRLAFYTPDWKHVALEKVIDVPDFQDFWVASDTVSQERIQAMQKKMDVRFVSVTFSAKEPVLTFELVPAFMEEKDIAAIKPMLRPVVYRWNGKKMEADQF